MKTILKSNEDRDAFSNIVLATDCSKRKYVAEFKVYRKPRTLPQNRLFHVLMNCIVRDTEIGKGFTSEELKEYFIGRYSPWYTKEINGQEVVFKKRTSQLDSKEMTTLIDGVYRDGVEIFEAAYLPRPGDRMFEQFYSKYCNE
jgi:hypothetical protein